MTWPGEELIIRLWGTLVEKGIGSLLTPWQIKREGRAHIEVRRTETLAIAQTENDAEDIRTGRKRIEDFLPGLKFSIAEQALADHKEPIEPTISLPAVAKASARQMLEDSVRRQVNVAKAIVQAEQRLRGDSQDPPKEKINDDWLYRWRDYASDVSAEEMQQLWGNLLAGELKAPGSYSFRCLDSLRNLSQSEAKKIEKISPFVLENMLWRNEDNLFKSEGITLSTLLEMQELGIISGVESLGIKMTWSTNQPDKFSQALRSNGKVLIVKHDDPKKIIKLNAYMLTSIGKQILKLGSFQPHLNYLKTIGKTICNQGFLVTIGDYVNISETEFQFFNEVSIETQQGTHVDSPAINGPAA